MHVYTFLFKASIVTGVLRVDLTRLWTILYKGTTCTEKLTFGKSREMRKGFSPTTGEIGLSADPLLLKKETFSFQSAFHPIFTNKQGTFNGSCNFLGKPKLLVVSAKVKSPKRDIPTDGQSAKIVPYLWENATNVTSNIYTYVVCFTSMCEHTPRCTLVESLIVIPRYKWNKARQWNI